MNLLSRTLLCILCCAHWNSAGDADEELLTFMTSYVEQRATVLHNLKKAHEGKLVKLVELRDLDMLSVATFMGSRTPVPYTVAV